jgi:hypothetical protein
MRRSAPLNHPPFFSLFQPSTPHQPQGPGVSDLNAAERALNLVTTIPYAILAARHARAARTPERRLYAASLGAVTAACTAFHATAGSAKEWARRADVWSIAAAATALTRLVHPKADAQHLTHVAVALTPVQPFAVIAVHALTAEVDFARAAKHDPALRGAWRSHVAATSVGLAAWAAEDADPLLPFCHCAWHVLSAVGMGCTEPFIAAAEDKLLRARGQL